LAERTVVAAERTLAFGPFHLLPTERLLLEEGEPVRLGDRALDILIALTERPGELVGKAELLARVWPGRFVEEGNLKFQIAALRRTLGDGRRGRRYIATSVGQGYRFVAPVLVAQDSSPAAPFATPTTRAHNLPGLLVRLIGRAGTVARIAARLPRQRFVTIVGPGGIGKTSVAVAVAQSLLGAYEDGVWLIDLAPVGEAGLVATALAAAIGCETRAEDPLTGLIAVLKRKRMLLVLDNCEHVAEAAANLAVTILESAAGVNVLATSREPLRAQGEYLHRLTALDTPPLSTRLDATEALAFPAVELFVERAAAGLGDYQLDDADAPIVAEICRRLDGIPLAIEFAAARLGAFGIRGLSARLHDRLRLLTRGARSAPARHSTLRAVLDWSYGLLTEAEQKALRRLAIFAGTFPFEGAAVVAEDATEPGRDTIDDIAELISKSLVLAESGDAELHLRLPETMRAYALAKLRESGETDIAARRHAEFYRDVFERAEAEWDGQSAAVSLAAYARHIDNLRAALDWAFSLNGDASIGVSLTAAAVPLWMHLSLLEECRRYVEQAIAALAMQAEPNARREMALYAAMGAALLYTRGGVAEMAAAWTKALELAQSLGDPEYEMRALWGLWSFQVNGVQYRAALELAHRFASLAARRSNLNDRAVGERMIGMSYHYLGDQKSAQRHIKRALADCAAGDHKRQAFRLQLDPQVIARVHLARTLWLQGFPDRAMREAEHSIEDARAAGHAISFSYALARAACPIGLWIGDLAAAKQYADILRDHSQEHALPNWQLYGRGYQGAVAVKRGDVATGLRLLGVSYDDVGVTGIAAPRFMRFAVLYTAEALAQTGRIAEGLTTIEDAIARAERTAELWQFAELLRFKGELVLLQRTPGATAVAEDHFRQALDCGRRHDAVSWELRAATSLAQLWRAQNRSGEARNLLSSVYARFTEGFGSADLQIARKLLDDLD
jgi:predicted ATPase/DNA-binding winged helix-turn-helix (wHTH) protein